MSQNDKLLKNMGLPILKPNDKEKLRKQWQSETWDDMILSLNSYGKYIMLRPTGFGKTFMCARACNIGKHRVVNGVDVDSDLTKGQIRLTSGTVIKNERLANIANKKVIFVYISDILKNTFSAYDSKFNSSLILPDRNGDSRIVYETYNMVAGHWSDREYLEKTLDIKNVGLVIFDEVQRMGANETSKALDIALPILRKYGIYYIGATATVERATGYDVCDKYFTYKHPNTGKLTYCWGEHIYTLEDTFKSGLIIPPEYQYIEENKDIIKKARQTRLSMLQELKVELASAKNEEDKKAYIREIKELESSVIKNSSKIIHDTMLSLYNCNDSVINIAESLEKADKGSIEKPKNLPNYMRFLVFTPDRESMSHYVKDMNSDEVFGGMVKQTYNDFHKAFGRYGYKVRTTIISSLNSTEKSNVRLLSEHTVTEEDIASGKAAIPQDMVIDLIFSINMLNVGYHVEHITGLIFKRWTGSNQIFYQQLGRCLSVNSDKIPVVFDFVKSIDSRGITAPLFTRTNQNKDITENADGTQNTVYKNNTKNDESPKKKDKSNNDLLLDNEGNLIDPRKCNTINAKYITVSMTSASINDILDRQKVYELRNNAKELFEKSYRLYTSNVSINNGKLISDISKIMCLRDSLRLTILKNYNKELSSTEIESINFKAYIEYLKASEKSVLVEYNALQDYIHSKGKGTKFKALSFEINSILASSKTNNSKGVSIKVLLNSKDLQKLKEDAETIKALQAKGFNINTDLIMYELN